MRLLICAGGTGGGVFPALAVLQELTNDRSRQASDNRRATSSLEALLWVGGIKGMEEQLVEQAGIPFKAIPAAGVHGVGLKALPGNALRLVRGYMAARRILRDFRPEVLFFTGGYVSVPVALAARLPGRGYPRARSLLYIPDIEPGLALKSLTRFADRVAVTTPNTQTYLGSHPSMVVSGYPTRTELGNWSREKSLEVLELTQDLPVLLVFGGSKGARSINKAIWGMLPELLGEMQVLHITGHLDWPEVDGVVQRLSNVLPEPVLARYHPHAFLHAEMGAAFRAADLAVCRAGASTLGELPQFGLPAILIPYPYAWRYQHVNANYLAERGAAAILKDADLTTHLFPAVRDLIRDAAKRAEMSSAMLALSMPDAARTIAMQLYDLAADLRR